MTCQFCGHAYMTGFAEKQSNVHWCDRCGSIRVWSTNTSEVFWMAPKNAKEREGYQDFKAPTTKPLSDSNLVVGGDKK